MKIVVTVAFETVWTTRNRTNGCCTTNTVPATPVEAVTAGVYVIVESSVDPSKLPSMVNVVVPPVNTADNSSDVYPVVSYHTVTSGDAAVVKGVVFAQIL
jgi:hypothetical protein